MSKKVTTTDKNPGMMMFYSFICIMVSSAVVIAAANLWFPNNVVLGTMSLSTLWAIILSSSAISVIGTFAMPFIHQWEIQRDKMATAAEMFMLYLGINFAAVWLLTRVAEVFGLGVTSWIVALLLAAALDLIQGVTMMWLESTRKK